MLAKKYVSLFGGTCLETIIQGSFVDQKKIAQRKKEVLARLRKYYGDLVVDPGNWIRWLCEHVPTRLMPLAAQLRHLGMVSTDRNLNRLIAFHDSHRKYPRDVLIQSFDGFDKSVRVPLELTIEEAREILRRLTPSQWTNFLKRRSARYRKDEIDDLCRDDNEWRAAWRRLDDSSRRAVVALASLSDDLEDYPAEQLAKATVLFEPGRGPRVLPFFAWQDHIGPALVIWLSDDLRDEVTAWCWRTDRDRDFDFSQCRQVLDVPDDVVLGLEALAFWESPTWYRNAGFQPLKAARENSHAKPARVDSVDQKSMLRAIPCLERLLEVAKFKGKQTFDSQVAWLKSRLNSIGYSWQEFLWQAERYNTSPDCRERVDIVTARLCR